MIVSAWLSCSAVFAQEAAQDGKYGVTGRRDTAEHYCVHTRGEGSFYFKIGASDMLSDVTLANGMILKINGTILQRDGSRIILKTGDCVDKQGRVTRSGIPLIPPQSSDPKQN